MSSQKKIANRKLVKRRKWVLVAEAAKLLSDSLGEEVSEASLVRLALDGELKLSIYIPDSTPARPCLGCVADLSEPPKITGMQDFYWLGRMLKAEDSICHLNEQLYDLPMIGAEKSILYHHWQRLRGTPVGEYTYGLETVVEGESGRLYLLQTFYLKDEPMVDFVNGELNVKPHSGAGDYGPSNGFPVGSELVVRKSELLKLEESFGGEKGLDLDGEIAEKPVKEEIEGEPTELVKPKSERLKKNNKKEPILRILDGSEEPSLPGKIIEEQGIKRLAGPETGYLRLKQIIGNPKKGILPIIPVSKSTWYAGVKSGRYPKSVKLSDHSTGWKISDIMALQERMEKGES